MVTGHTHHKLNPPKQMYRKYESLEKTRSLLEEAGIVEGKDYIFSLQGPTVIVTVAGYKKFKSLDKSSVDKIESMRVKMLIE